MIGQSLDGHWVPLVPFLSIPLYPLHFLQSLQLKASLEMLVVDEADLTFSYGFEEDMRRLLPHLPRIYQAILMSATLSADVVTLKKLVLHNPVRVGGV